MRTALLLRWYRAMATRMRTEGRAESHQPQPLETARNTEPAAHSARAETQPSKHDRLVRSVRSVGISIRRRRLRQLGNGVARCSVQRHERASSREVPLARLHSPSKRRTLGFSCKAAFKDTGPRMRATLSLPCQLQPLVRRLVRKGAGRHCPGTSAAGVNRSTTSIDTRDIIQHTNHGVTSLRRAPHSG